MPNNKGRQSAEKIGIKRTSDLDAQILEHYIKQWKIYRGKGERYTPLESFLPRTILNDTNSMLTVEKIAKEFELERLKRLLDQDKKKPNGNKRFVNCNIFCGWDLD